MEGISGIELTVSAHTFLDVDFDSGCSVSFLDSNFISFVDSCCDFSICFSFMTVFLVSVVLWHIFCAPLRYQPSRQVGRNF